MLETATTRRSSAAWRDRLAGRTRASDGEAEAAIHQAYRESGLASPGRVVWADGPDEAAETVAFLVRPPRAQRRRAYFYAALGAVPWMGFVLAIMHNPNFQDNRIVLGAVLALVLGGSPLCLALCARLPNPPGQGAPGAAGRVPAWAVAGILCAAVAQVVALTSIGYVPADPVGGALTLGSAAIMGAFPGMLLWYRIQRTYRELPRFLREVRPVRSVAQKMRAAREGAWKDVADVPEGWGPSEALVWAFGEVHRLAFALRGPFGLGREDPAVPPAPRAPGEDGTRTRPLTAPAARAMGGPRWHVFGWVPPNLDGIEDAARAAAIDRAGNRASRTARGFARLAYCVDRIYPFASIVVAVRPPVVERLDAEGRPHSEAGPALAWADGSSFYAWRGRPVPPELVDPAIPVTLARVLREFDPGSRWVLIERYGLGRFMRDAGAQELHRNSSGTLYRLRSIVGPPIVAVRVVNHSPEPDGTYKEFWLRVPPSVLTAREAVAWTFGLREHEYRPWQQS